MYLGAMDGVSWLDGERLEPLGLKGERIWAIYARGDVVLAGMTSCGSDRSGSPSRRPDRPG